MVSLDNIFEAYFDCRKNKSGKESAVEFEVDYESNLIELWESVVNRTYKPSKSIAFIVTKPRRREIFAANFRDRVMHHYVDLRLRPIIERTLVDTTCNNRIGKGTMACVKYAEKFMREESENYTTDCYVCKMDMKGFFMSISKSKLTNKTIDLTREFYKGDDIEDLIWLIDVILSDSPEKNCELRSPKSEWKKLDRNKSLFFIDDDLGLPIGNLISQLLVNFYLDEFDHYLMEELRFSKTARYVDDFVIFSKEKERLLYSIPLMRKKLEDIGVTLHPDKFYFQHYSKGVEIVGSVVKVGRTYLHNRTVNNGFRAIEELNRLKVCEANIEKVQSVVNSYLGFMKHTASFKIRYRLLESLSKKWWKYFSTVGSKTKITLNKDYNKAHLLRNKLNKQRRGQWKYKKKSIAKKVAS
jgi:RNA-directed DNA polymerase